MAQYIDKDALGAEIERLEKINQAYKKTWKWKFKWFYCTIIGRLEVLEGLKNYIDTLEVKEVDLEKEIDFAMPSRYCWSGDGKAVYTKEQMRNFAKHFFELGMQVSNKTQKGE